MREDSRPTSNPESGENEPPDPRSSRLAASASPDDGARRRETVVVGVGASAGGIEALKELFANVPPGTGAAFVVVQHLAPDVRSLMDQLLGRHTRLAVHDASNDEVMRPNAVYLVPPRKIARVDGDRLLLEDPADDQSARYPIDRFFLALSRERGAGSIGVVLSGSGTDGTMGVHAIKKAGGLVFVQDFASAKFDGMPRSAAATGLADFVLTPPSIARRLGAYVRKLGARPEGADPHPDPGSAEIAEILGLLGLGPNAPLTGALEACVTRRMRLLGISEPDVYRAALSGNRGEFDALRATIVAAESTFFRRAATIELLKEKALPRVLETAATDEALRTWVVGCGTGEEAYSVAMAMDEMLSDRGLAIRNKVFATDSDRGRIATAYSGLYALAEDDDVSAGRMERYFVSRGRRSQVVNAIRERVLFSVHDFHADPPFSGMHLVSARGIWPLVGRGQEANALSHIRYALKPHGILFLGRPGFLGDLREDFGVIDEAAGIYQRKPQSATISIPVVTPAEITEPVTDIHRAQRALRESEERLRAMTEHSEDVFWMMRSDTLDVLYVSRAYESNWGQSIEDLYIDGSRRLNAVHPEDRERVRGHLQRDVRDGTYDVEYRILRPDGEIRWIRDRVFPIVDDDRQVRRVAGVAEDVSERIEAEIAHRNAAEMFRGAFDHARVGMVLLRRRGGFDRVNQSLCGLLARDEADLLTTDLLSIVHPDEHASVTACLQGVFDEEVTVAECECRLRRSDGDDVWVHMSGALARGAEAETSRFVGHVIDVTERKREEIRVEELTATFESQANSDPLTGLLNRRGLEKVLSSQLSQSRRSGTQLSAILVDCDNFRRVNDEVGHDAGDAVLREISRRVGEALRPSDWFARIGGDEFLVLLPDTRIAEGLHVAEKLRRSIALHRVVVDDRGFGVTASFGVATVTPDVHTIEDLLQCTHDALARSKARGKNRVNGSAEGAPPVRSGVADREELTAGHGFRTAVQPIWELRENKVIGFEVLSRGPVGPLERPADLFQICMDEHLLTPVDIGCLERALSCATRLEPDRRIHVNLFPSTILETPPDELVDRFERTGQPARFCLEISEQQLVGDPAALLDRVQTLRRHGVEIAIDDVGFGRSSLETLIILEPDVIKIDRSMVSGVASEPGLRRSLDRLTQVSRSLDAHLIAEGIETRDDRQTLLDMGVTAGQGFLWGRPYLLS